MKNKMVEVAKLLGLELEEEFRIKYDNKAIYVLKEDGFFEVVGRNTYLQRDIYNLLNGEWEVVKIPKQILDDVEREYLSAVIKPFRDKVKWIKKYSSPTENFEYIRISYRDHNYSNVLNFPDFKVGTMYRGMKLDKLYTLKELEI